MSEIKVGDMVMVVRGMPCCGATGRHMGHTFVVSAVKPQDVGNCSYCGHFFEIVPTARDESFKPCPIYRLKRIDPPALDETLETSREVTI